MRDNQMSENQYLDEVYGEDTEYDADGNVLVAAEFACPECHERRMDWLLWTEGDTVQCATCGNVYTTDQEAANA